MSNTDIRHVDIIRDYVDTFNEVYKDKKVNSIDSINNMGRFCIGQKILNRSCVFGLCPYYEYGYLEGEYAVAGLA